MTRRVRVTRPAHRDLREIALYIGRDSRGAAAQIVRDLYAAFEKLAAAPGLGHSRDDLSSGLRSFTVGNYLIFYRVGTQEVRIIRVLHGARNLPEQFPEQ